MQVILHIELVKKKIMGQDVLQKIRHCDIVSLTNLSLLCKLLDCQPGDIMEYVKGERYGQESDS